MKKVGIVLNTPEKIATIQEQDVICADGGLSHYFGTPIAVVGDFDSLQNIPSDINKITYPKEKNETDSQLAIDIAKKLGYDTIVIYGALGGRIDHVLGNIGLLEYAKSIGLDATIKETNLEISLADGDFNREVLIGETISFFPLFSDALVESSYGLYYPLNNLSLKKGTNRGISNISTDKKIGLKITSGTLLYIRHYK